MSVRVLPKISLNDLYIGELGQQQWFIKAFIIEFYNYFWCRHILILIINHLQMNRQMISVTKKQLHSIKMLCPDTNRVFDVVRVIPSLPYAL